MGPTYKSFRSVYTPHSPNPTENHPTVSSDVSMYTMENNAGLTDQDFLGQIPPLDCISQDGYSTDALCYYGMDIGTWVGLDNMRWDEG
jgi:hypothetical protein